MRGIPGLLPFGGFHLLQGMTLEPTFHERVGQKREEQRIDKKTAGMRYSLMFLFLYVVEWAQVQAQAPPLHRSPTRLSFRSPIHCLVLLLHLLGHRRQF